MNAAYDNSENTQGKEKKNQNEYETWKEKKCKTQVL